MQGREDTKSAGLEWHFHSQDELPMMHDYTTQNFISSSLIAERLAMLSAQHQARELCFDKICLASNSQQLICAVNTKTTSKKLYGILHDISYLFSFFSEISVMFVHREGNVPAVSLVKQAL